MSRINIPPMSNREACDALRADLRQAQSTLAMIRAPFTIIGPNGELIPGYNTQAFCPYEEGVHKLERKLWRFEQDVHEQSDEEIEADLLFRLRFGRSSL